MRGSKSTTTVIVLEVDHPGNPYDIKSFRLETQTVEWLPFDDFYSWGGVTVERLY
jgi:hypothetical protein